MVYCGGVVYDIPPVVIFLVLDYCHPGWYIVEVWYIYTLPPVMKYFVVFVLIGWFVVAD